MSVIRRNIFWLLISQAATWVATLAALLIVPNKLGSTDFGTLGFAVGYVEFFRLFAALGVSTYLSRAIARDHSLTGPYVWNAVLLKAVSCIALSLVALGLAYALGNRGTTLAIIAICCAGMLPAVMSEVFFGALTGMQRMARPAMWMIAQVYFQTVFGILVLMLGWGVVAYAVVMTLGVLIPAAGTAVMVLPYVRGHLSFDFKIWRLLVVGGIPLLALTFLNLIYGTVDVPILHSMVGSEPVGWYAVALRWASIPVFITTAVVVAYFPAFSQHGNPLTDAFAPLVNRAIHIVLLIAVPACVGLFFIADQLINLFYDEGYENAVVLVQILAFGIPIMGLDTVLATALVACDRLGRYLWIAAVAAVMNPVLCVVAIHLTDSRWENGAIGAAVITVATEVCVMLGALWLRAPGVLDRASVGRIGRIALACTAMVPVMVLSSGLHLVIRIVLGSITYGIAILVVGGLSVSDLKEELQRIRSSRGGSGGGDEGDEDDEDDDVDLPPGFIPDTGLAPLPPVGEVP